MSPNCRLNNTGGGVEVASSCSGQHEIQGFQRGWNANRIEQLGNLQPGWLWLWPKYLCSGSLEDPANLWCQHRNQSWTWQGFVQRIHCYLPKQVCTTFLDGVEWVVFVLRWFLPSNCRVTSPSCGVTNNNTIFIIQERNTATSTMSGSSLCYTIAIIII